MGNCTRRDFLAGLGASAAAAAVCPCVFAETGNESRMNILLITADDMDYGSLGATGCKVPDITPNLDKLASEGVLFQQAHVTSAICQPSRSALMTGRFPHRNGALGFRPIDPSVPTLQESLRGAGYLNGIMAKVGHLAPRAKFPWDVVVEAADLGSGKDPQQYYRQSKAFFEKARAEGKPFFLMANSQDPHRPFPGTDRPAGRRRASASEPAEPKRWYRPGEIEVPGFLPDIEGVREELAQYFTAVHRCDEAVGQVLKALKETGFEKNTVVFFLSDNGISEPFAKTNCYFCSTRTPLIVRWPGKVKPGSINRNDLVAGVDFMPTVLEIAGIKTAEGMDGRSYVPVLEGRKQEGRDKVFTFITSTSAGSQYPMRCVRTKRYSYIFNAWSDGKTQFRNEPMGGMAFKAMQLAAEKDPGIAERVDFFLHRVAEELYDLQSDPHEMKNLISDPNQKDQLDKMRDWMLEMMVSTKDPLLETFRVISKK